MRPGGGPVAVLAVALLAAVGGEGAAQEPWEALPVRSWTLENGLRVVVLPRHASPTVSFVVRYDVGGVHERLGNTGVAHLLEHLLFKGTTTVGTRDLDAELALFGRIDAAHDTLLRARAAGDSAARSRLEGVIGELEDRARQHVEPNELDRILTRAGAQGLNAMTTNEATTYFVELPANRAELWFALEADRVRNAVFREFYTERDVVAEERRLRVETSPGGLLYEAHLAAAFTVHPYGVPVVGHMSDIEGLGRRDVAEYFRRYYGPNNAVVAIVGDVDAEAVRGWVDGYLALIARGEEPPPVLAREPEQRGERRVEVLWDAEPALRIGWKVPSGLHADAAALTVLTALLTGGRTSRLHARLVVEDRLATSIFSVLGPGVRFPRLFQIDATPRAPHETAEVETAIYEEIARLAEEGPSPDELARVRTRVAAGAVRRLQSNLGLAFQLAESEGLHGDWRETFRSTAALRDVKAEDVRDVVRRYLTREGRTVATLRRAERRP